MAVGSKSFPEEVVVPVQPAAAGQGLASDALDSRRLVLWGEVLLVFVLLEVVLWTPRSLAHSLLIAITVGSAAWIGFRGRTREELGLIWPGRRGTAWILGLGGGIALAIPAVALLTGHPVPANPDWPGFKNIWPYVIWAVGQQFLLQSIFYLRLEALLGARRAVLATVALFTVAHLPNMPLTAMTFLGAWFFTEMFRRYRSIYPLGIAHAMLGIAIAYSFPDSLMHHMRVGLSFWQFR